MEGKVKDDELKEILLEKFNKKYDDVDVPEGFIEYEGKAYWVKPSGAYRVATD